MNTEASCSAQLPPSARRAAELRAAGTKPSLKTLSLAACLVEAQELTEAGALVAFEAESPADSGDASAPSTSSRPQSGARIRSLSQATGAAAAPAWGRTSGAPRPRARLQDASIASSRVLPYGAPAPAESTSRLSNVESSGESGEGTSNADNSSIEMPAEGDEVPTEVHPMALSKVNGKQQSFAAKVTAKPKQVARQASEYIKQQAVDYKDSMVNWQPPTVSQVKDGLHR